MGTLRGSQYLPALWLQALRLWQQLQAVGKARLRRRVFLARLDALPECS